VTGRGRPAPPEGRPPTQPAWVWCTWRAGGVHSNVASQHSAPSGTSCPAPRLPATHAATAPPAHLDCRRCISFTGNNLRAWQTRTADAFRNRDACLPVRRSRAERVSTIVRTSRSGRGAPASRAHPPKAKQRHALRVRHCARFYLATPEFMPILAKKLGQSDSSSADRPVSDYLGRHARGGWCV
jgi:hypothetical protein